jgi:hypothetical protein
VRVGASVAPTKESSLLASPNVRLVCSPNAVPDTQVGHVLCMASSFAGALYMLWAITTVPPSSLLGSADSPALERGLVAFRTIATLIIIAGSLAQIVLVLLGQYAAHRWLGRVVVRLVTASTLFTLLLQTSPAAIAVTSAVLILELLAYFTWKCRVECGAESVAPTLLAVGADAAGAATPPGAAASHAKGALAAEGTWATDSSVDTPAADSALV